MSNTLTETRRFEEPLAQLRQARRGLIDEQRRVTRDLVALDKAIRALERIRRGDDTTSGAANGNKESTPGAPNGLEKMTAREAARAVLAKSPRPLSVRELLSAMEDAGRPVTAKSYHAVYKQLRRHREFKNLEGRWHLADGANGS